MKGLFNVNWVNIKSAIVYGLLTMVVTFIASVAVTVYHAGTFYGIDWAHTIDQAGIEALGFFVAGISVLKNILTNDKGKFLNTVTVIPDKTE